MKIHLRQVPEQGSHLEGEEDCPIPELAADGIDCAGPMHYSLDAGVSNGALWVNGRLSQQVELPCVACMERFVHTIEVPDFALLTDLTGPETVDLAPFIREDILLNLPAYPRCDRGGERVCQAAHVMREEGATSDGKRQPDWSALDKLKLKS